MIRAVFKKSGGAHKKVIGFEISGHAGYADKGEDIVCAAVTSAVQFSANAITEIAAVDADVKADDNCISLALPENIGSDNADYAAQVILKALILHLKTLSEQYEETIRVIVMEVK